MRFTRMNIDFYLRHTSWTIRSAQGCAMYEMGRPSGYEIRVLGRIAKCPSECDR